jgi:hypothetical protein
MLEANLQRPGPGSNQTTRFLRFIAWPGGCTHSTPNGHDGWRKLGATADPVGFVEARHSPGGRHSMGGVVSVHTVAGALDGSTGSGDISNWRRVAAETTGRRLVWVASIFGRLRRVASAHRQRPHPRGRLAHRRLERAHRLRQYCCSPAKPGQLRSRCAYQLRPRRDGAGCDAAGYNQPCGAARPCGRGGARLELRTGSGNIRVDERGFCPPRHRPFDSDLPAT